MTVWSPSRRTGLGLAMGLLSLFLILPTAQADARAETEKWPDTSPVNVGGELVVYTEPFDFPTAEIEQRYRVLVDELRCPKCQNQNLADSDAVIAADLRAEVYRQLRQGRTDPEIVDYMVSRYGQFVLYRPPWEATTALLWSGPVVLALAGVGGLLYWIRQRRRRLEANHSAVLSDEDIQRLRSLLVADGAAAGPGREPGAVSPTEARSPSVVDQDTQT